MSSSVDTDAEDVNDFLKRIQELGSKRDQEDEERNRKLEEEILQGRKERQARRAERARSISPTKDSPVSTPTTSERVRNLRVTLSPAPDLQPKGEILPRGAVSKTNVDNSGVCSPTKENTVPLGGSEHVHTELDVQRMNSFKESPSSAMPPSRSSPLSWQRRPTSQILDQPRSRPLSMIAAENAARSPRATPEPSISSDVESAPTRDQIAQMLSSKDPTWFRQTAERGENSPAYRKNQVDDIDVVDVVSSSRVQMPGMSKEPTRPLGSNNTTAADMDRSSSLSRNTSSTGSSMLLTDAQRLDPPLDTCSDDMLGSRRSLAMSPSQGRISPERLDRPSSPTKGMGGFVQSAMMKRSDSVSKRWSVQSPTGLSRGNSIASNRSSIEPSVNQYNGGIPARDSRPNSVSRDNSPLPLSRPTSSHSNATIVQDGERPGTSNSMKSSITVSSLKDGFAKPALPSNKSQSLSSTAEGPVDSTKGSHSETTPPSSPSKFSDSRRWSPTKSSWLESALNKPDSPKPKPAPATPQQPVWMSEINKAKQRNNAESTRSPQAPKHEVNIGGLMRSPPPGGLTKPPVMRGFVGAIPSGSTKRENSTNIDSPIAIGQGEIVAPLPKSRQAELATQRMEPEPLGLSSGKESVSSTNIQSSSVKVKPETPPKKDFRSALKPRQLVADSDDKEEPEFKNVFGQLRRTKTQNYVAPDELKNNILRGKAGLNATGGPKKTERKDEFKEAILKKKEDFKRAQLEGIGVTRPERSNTEKDTQPLPEALAKKAAMSKSKVSTTDSSSSIDAGTGLSAVKPKQNMSIESQMPTLHKEISAPGRMQSKEATGAKLADRFNPALANLLARGPPSTASDTSRTSSPVTSQRTVSTSTRSSNHEDVGSGPQLTHMTKARARGPRRKAPSAALSTGHQPNIPETWEEARPEQATAQGQDQYAKAASESGTLNRPFLSRGNSENEESHPHSPEKLDMKRRSRFFEDPKPDLKPQQHLEPSTQRSPTKKSDNDELVITKLDPKPVIQDRKVTPNAKPKPASLSRTGISTDEAVVSTSSQTLSAASNSSSPDLATSPQFKMQSTSPVKETEKLRRGEIVSDVDSLASVKSGVALFSRRTAKEDARPSPAAKAPVKLPTQADENIARTGTSLMPQKMDLVRGPVTLSNNVSAGLSFPSQDTSDKGLLPPLSIRNGAITSVAKSPKLLPSSPSQILVSSPKIDIKPLSPKKPTSQAVPQSSEASKLLVNFFGKHDFVPNSNIDTAAVLSNRPADPAKIKTLRSQLFQISGDGKKLPVPHHQERILFENNMYICPHTFGSSVGKKVVEVYFWAGDGVAESSVDDAVIFAQREAKAAGGKLLKLRQSQETSEFIEALGGIMVIRRGSSSNYDSLAPHILCGRRFAGQIVFDEVDFTTSSLCSGFPYLILTQSGKSYLWKGKGSGVDELSCARLIGMDFGLTGELEEVEDGNESTSFLKIFGNETKMFHSADHWRLKPNYPKYCARLFCPDSASKSQIIELHPFNQSSLSASQIYILDAFFEIYIIVGSASQTQYAAFCAALVFAQEYGILAAGMEDRPFVPVSTVVFEGVPRDLKACFRKWKEGQGPTMQNSRTIPQGLQRGKSLRIVPLNAALDATRF